MLKRPAKKAAEKKARVKSPVLLGGMPRAMGVRIVSLTRKRVVGEMRIKPMHVNRYGNVNGGAMMAFGDVLGAAGAVANMPPGHRGGTKKFQAIAEHHHPPLGQAVGTGPDKRCEHNKRHDKELL